MNQLAAGVLTVVSTFVALAPGAICGNFDWPAPGALREIARIRAHLMAAERVVAKRDVSRLSREPRESRAQLFQTLRNYRQRGRFPKNLDFPDRRVPYFIDRDGTRCAMACLIESTGDSEIVARIAHTRNNAYISDLADDADLLAWLDRNGLTAAEAARIQPQYGNVAPRNSKDLDPVLVGCTMGLETAGVFLTVDPPQSSRARAWRGGYALFAGFGGVIEGIALLDRHGNVGPAWGGACLTLGMVSFFMGAHCVAHRSTPSGYTRVEPTGWTSVGGAPGLALRVRF